VGKFIIIDSNSLGTINLPHFTLLFVFTSARDHHSDVLVIAISLLCEWLYKTVSVANSEVACPLTSLVSPKCHKIARTGPSVRFTRFVSRMNICEL